MVVGQSLPTIAKLPELKKTRDRTMPVGYKLSVIPFANGEPVAAPDNKSSTTDVFSNADNSVCPQSCFRPVGIAFDAQGRLFVSSDATGEIYVVVRDQTAQGGASTSTGSAPSPTASSKSDAARMAGYNFGVGMFALLVLCMLL